MNENVLRVPNGSLRFSPTPELFAALGQEVPAAVATAGAPRTTPGATGTAGATANARFAQLTPEQRAQFRAQREAAGGTTRGGAEGVAQASRGADASGPRSFGRVWVIRDGKLQPARVRTGVTDGAMTAIVDGDLKEGDQVVTGMSEPGAATTQTNTSPLIPFGRRGGGAGAGGGGARGGAGR